MVKNGREMELSVNLLLNKDVLLALCDVLCCYFSIVYAKKRSRKTVSSIESDVPIAQECTFIFVNCDFGKTENVHDAESKAQSNGSGGENM